MRVPRIDPRLPEDITNAVQNIYDSLNNEFGWNITLQGNLNGINIDIIQQYAKMPDIYPRMLRIDPDLPEDITDAVQNMYNSLNNEFGWILHCNIITIA
jgi:hypothetical protein